MNKMVTVTYFLTRVEQQAEDRGIARIEQGRMNDDVSGEVKGQRAEW